MVSEVGWSSSNPQSHYPSMETSQKTGADGNKDSRYIYDSFGQRYEVRHNKISHVPTRSRATHSTLTFDNEDDQKKLSVLVEKFEEYCTPRRNVT